MIVGCLVGIPTVRSPRGTHTPARVEQEFWSEKAEASLPPAMVGLLLYHSGAPHMGRAKGSPQSHT